MTGLAPLGHRVAVVAPLEPAAAYAQAEDGRGRSDMAVGAPIVPLLGRRILRYI
jgi:hypothetical protein